MNTTLQKQMQADHFDHIEDSEFEIDRPHGQSRLYQRLIRYKLERVVELLDEPICGRTVLAICCGSGMDAEFLGELGARVVATDISLGALRRAQERSRRYGAAYALAVADAERLPFASGSFDYCFVHDGLHHLPNPALAVREMARVSSRAVLITEPADSVLTAIAIRVGVLQAYEQAGNYVVRFRPRTLGTWCAVDGLDRYRASRYLMRYGHPPAALWRRFDHSVPLALACAVFNLFGVHLLGRLGNKIAFVALRSAPLRESESYGVTDAGGLSQGIRRFGDEPPPAERLGLVLGLGR